MKEKEYLYIVVRNDLPLAQKSVQAVHASIEALRDKNKELEAKIQEIESTYK